MPNAIDRYPIAPSERKHLPKNCEAAGARGTGEFRVPRRGDWYISGAIPEAYYATSDGHISPYHIARLVNADGIDVQTPEKTVAQVLKEGFTAPPDAGLDLTLSVNGTDESTDSRFAKLKENIAAVSAILHADSRHQTFYDRYAATLSGFPGIWRYCVDAAEAFTAVEQSLGDELDDEWIETIEGFALALFAVLDDCSRGPLTGDELTNLARQHIQAALVRLRPPHLNPTEHGRR